MASMTPYERDLLSEQIRQSRSLANVATQLKEMNKQLAALNINFSAFIAALQEYDGEGNDSAG